jgi:hypothetical protein
VDINRVLDELRQERMHLEEAILSMERLAVGHGKRRGRPPAWMTAAKSSVSGAKRRGRPPGTKNRNTEANAVSA